MKRSSTMMRVESEEARELFLVATNRGELHDRYAKPYIEMLAKKMKAGKYDKELAVDLWYKMACAASDQYLKDFGYKFSVQERFTAACEMEEFYREDVEDKANE